MTSRLRAEFNNVCAGRGCAFCPFNMIGPPCGDVFEKSNKKVNMGVFSELKGGYSKGDIKIKKEEWVDYIYNNTRRRDFYFMNKFFKEAVKEGKLDLGIDII